MARKRRKARKSSRKRRSSSRKSAPRRRRRRSAAAAAPRRRRHHRARKSAPRRHRRRHALALAPKRRHHRRRSSSRSRKRNPFGLTGMHGLKSTLPVVLAGAVAGAAIYAAPRLMAKLPLPTSKFGSAAAVAGVGALGAIAAAMLAGPAAGAIVAAAFTPLALSVVIDTATTSSGSTSSMMPMKGYQSLKPGILPMGTVLSDNLGKLRPLGTVLSQDLSGFGAGSNMRKHQSMSEAEDMVKKLGPRF